MLQRPPGWFCVTYFRGIIYIIPPRVHTPSKTLPTAAVCLCVHVPKRDADTTARQLNTADYFLLQLIMDGIVVLEHTIEKNINMWLKDWQEVG